MKNLLLLFLFFCIWRVFCNWLMARSCLQLDFELSELFSVLVCSCLLVCACVWRYVNVCVSAFDIYLTLTSLHFLDSLLHFFHYILKFLGNYRCKHFFFSFLSAFPISCMLFDHLIICSPCLSPLSFLYVSDW